MGDCLGVRMIIMANYDRYASDHNGHSSILLFVPLLCDYISNRVVAAGREEMPIVIWLSRANDVSLCFCIINKGVTVGVVGGSDVFIFNFFC